MIPGTTASLLCPACGQAFLSMQQSMAGVAQCPHCAHSGPRAQFGTQAQVAGVAPGRRQFAQSQPLPQTMVPPPPSEVPATTTARPGVQTMPAASLTTSIARATLQPSQALLPTGAPPPAPTQEFSMPPHLRTSPWKPAFFLLAFAATCGVSLWLWWDHANAPAFKTKSTPQTPAAEPKPAVVIPPVAKSIAIKAEPPDTVAIAADMKTLVTELFAADTPERRAACVHDAAKHAEEIEGLFGASSAAKPELRLLARIPGLPLTLPGGQPMPLFKLVSSKCANGALIRLETGTDGKRRIYWPMFFETHQARLQQFLQKSTTEDAAWFHVGLRPSHGLDIPAELRPKYLTFDVQVAAGSDPHFVACVERDSPLGRFMDRESEWGKAYLSRLLVRKLDIQADAPCVVILDCEGASEGGDAK
jgi:hypothetical protein